MDIKLKNIKVKDLVKDYSDKDQEGVFGYSGKLNIRPQYQREFVYNPDQRSAVINSIFSDYPLNVMYWSIQSDGKYEVIDGQQRTISICQYVEGDFSFNQKYFHNLQNDEKEKILNYELMIYFCKGSDSEKLSWFRIINIAGEKLYNQELLNAIYSGPWVTDLKRHFSKNGCPAYELGNNYLKGSPIRQDYLETALKWKSNNKIEDYMGIHQNDVNANELWLYFQGIISWIKITFPKKRREMKGINWGFLHNQFKDKELNVNELEEEIVNLMQDRDVTNKPGIYSYVLTREEKYLNIRAFDENHKREAYEKQKGICVVCNKHFEFNEMEADHIDPWSKGGPTTSENCQLLCKEDNRRKSSI
ncbi:DUF262 domain-containing protein [Candidatus Pelagibacter sp.]|nr:DUF262 domain-containing protein [Candidatus Pelagibacter sp.]